MAKEIEHKFLVKDTSFIKESIESRLIKQGYIAENDIYEVRVSVRDHNSYICVKSTNSELVRDEYDYPIPDKDALEMFEKCPHKLYKTRYLVPGKEYGVMWEIDVFHGANEGLIIAEVEMESKTSKLQYYPEWLGEEVTGNEKFYNRNLAKNA